jgi:hypothetical protein
VANLANATLAGAALSGITPDDTTCPNGINSDLYADGCFSQRLYSISGFISPVLKAKLAKAARQIVVKFRLDNTAGKPVSSSVATAVTVACTWKAAAEYFQCVIKTPRVPVTRLPSRLSRTSAMALS